MIMAVWCTTYNKFLIGWVAIQYHWRLDSSCLYLACPSIGLVLLVFGLSFGLAQILHRLVQYPVILDGYPSNILSSLDILYEKTFVKKMNAFERIKVLQ